MDGGRAGGGQGRNFREAIHLKQMIKIKNKEVNGCFHFPLSVSAAGRIAENNYFSTLNDFVFLTYRFVSILIFHSSPYESKRACS